MDGAKKNLKSMEKELYVYRKKVDAENKVKESKRDAVRSKLNRARYVPPLVCVDLNLIVCTLMTGRS